MNVTPEVKKKMSLLDELKKLDEQRAALVQRAEGEARAKLDAALADYNSLGHNYVLSDGSQTAKKGKTGITRQRDPNTPCTVCNFVTDPPHDGRVHRSQGDKKKPFTDKELKEKGYIKKV